MQVQSTGSTAHTTSATGTSGRRELDKESFLALLVTQLRYQDPLSPMDNQEFIAQMAQFSALEQMHNLNEKFETSMYLTQSLNNSAAAGLIGRHVRATGDTVRLGESGGVELGYFLSQPANAVTVTVYDSDGEVVRTLVSTAEETGAHQLDWDGCDLAGERLPAGSYRFEVSAVGPDGESFTPSSLVNGLVDGVTYRDGIAYLLIGGREVSLSEVLEVYMPADS